MINVIGIAPSLGQGFNSVTGMPSVAASAVTGQAQSGGQSSITDYFVSTSFESMFSRLSLALSTSALSEFGNMDANGTFIEQLKMTTYSVALVVRSATTSSESYNNVQPAAPAPADLNAFCSTYGDSFISSRAIGSQYLAVYMFYASSYEEQASVSAALNASGITPYGIFGVGFQGSLDQVRSSIKTVSTLHQICVGRAAFAFPPESGLVQAALTFASTPADAPVVLAYQTTGYEAVYGQALFATVVANREKLNPSPVGIGLLGQAARLTSVLNDIRALKAVHAAYQFNDPILLSRETDVIADTTNLRNLLSSISNNFGNPIQDVPLPSLGYGSPKLNALPVPAPTWGGPGGDTQFNDDPDGLAIWRRQRLESITINGGKFVNGISGAFTIVTPDPGAANGETTTLVPFQHQGRQLANHTSQPFVIDPQDRVSRVVSPQWGDYVNQLWIETQNQGFAGHFAFPDVGQGMEVANQHGPDAPLGQNQVFVGFSGTTGDFLDRIEAIIYELRPATWVPWP